MLSAIATRQSGPPIHNCRETSPAFQTSTPHRTVSRPVEKISHFPLVSFSINIPVPVKKNLTAKPVNVLLKSKSGSIHQMSYFGNSIPVNSNLIKPTRSQILKNPRMLSINFKPVKLNRSSNPKINSKPPIGTVHCKFRICSKCRQITRDHTPSA